MKVDLGGCESSVVKMGSRKRIRVTSTIDVVNKQKIHLVKVTKTILSGFEMEVLHCKVISSINTIGDSVVKLFGIQGVCAVSGEPIFEVADAFCCQKQANDFTQLVNENSVYMYNFYDVLYDFIG